MDWMKFDIERRCGFPARKYTGTNLFFTLVVGIILMFVFYALLYPFYTTGGFRLVEMFFHGGPAKRSTIPYFIVALTCWSLAILVVKYLKLKLQRKALTVKLFHDYEDVTVTPSSVNKILGNIYNITADPAKFLLFNRMERALSNLKNIGRVGDVAEALSAQSDNDEAYLESTYTMLKAFIWAIPVLGFIGTVLGLSEAIGGFGAVVAQGADIQQLKSSLGGVTGGLSTAFETTLIALVAALMIQLLLSWVKNREEYFLDDCSDYCHRYITSRLKTVQ